MIRNTTHRYVAQCKFAHDIEWVEVLTHNDPHVLWHLADKATPAEAQLRIFDRVKPRVVRRRTR